MVRNAQFADIPSIVLFLQEAYSRTHYAASKVAEVDATECKRLLMNSIQRHGHSHGGACWVQVSETNGNIEGLMLGTLVRCYSILNKLMASDLFWVCSERADPRDAVALMRGFISWAKSCPHVVEIKCGTTAAIGDPADAGKILERLGMEQYGLIFRMEIGQ